MIPQWARFSILRIGRPSTTITVSQDGSQGSCVLAPGSPPVKEHRSILEAKANGVCDLCKGSEGPLVVEEAQIDHIRTVREFADDMTLDILEAFRQCWDLANLRLVHGPCNNARNKRNGADNGQ